MTTNTQTTGTVKFNTEYKEEDKAKLGKNPFLGKTVTTTDVKTSTIQDEWENVNDLNIKTDYSAPEVEETPDPVKPENPDDPGDLDD
jgi:hypothetical protein